MFFHAFLSRGSADKPAVEELARQLAKEGIKRDRGPGGTKLNEAKVDRHRWQY
jgi:hypothetical protein